MKKKSIISALLFMSIASSHAAQPVMLTDLTAKGSHIIPGINSDTPVLYISTENNPDLKSICSTVDIGLGDGKIAILDLTTSSSTANPDVKLLIKDLKSCILGSDLPGDLFLVSLIKNGKKVQTIDSKSASYTTLQNKIDKLKQGNN